MTTGTKFPEIKSEVRSADGTQISYRQLGSGPGLVILHGGGRASQHYTLLAEALAPSYTVYIPDRRGRGLSGPTGEDYNLTKACQDVEALLQKSGAKLLFGHSAGGVIALETALLFPLEALMLYEPAVSINHSIPTKWMADYELALAQNDPARAMALFIRVLQMNWMSNLPIWILSILFRMMLNGPESKEIIELLHTVPPEFRLAESIESKHERYRQISVNTLILSGSKSPAFLRDVMPQVAALIPHAVWTELPGLDHSAPEEEPAALIAERMKEFLAERV